jgi:hypothetical protein
MLPCESFAAREEETATLTPLQVLDTNAGNQKGEARQGALIEQTVICLLFNQFKTHFYKHFCFSPLRSQYDLQTIHSSIAMKMKTISKSVMMGINTKVLMKTHI